MANDPASLVEQGREKRLLFDVPGYEDAVPLLREAIELDPTHAPAYAELSLTYSSWGLRRERSCLGLGWERRVLEFQSLYGLAVDYARSATLLGPELARAHRALAAASRHGATADPELRARHAKTAFELDPDDPECACELWRADGYDPDDPAPRRALEKEPRLLEVRVDLAAALCDRGRYDEAGAELGLALKLHPTNVQLYYELAMLLQRQGRRSDGLEALTRARRLRASDPLVRQGFALLGEVAV